MNPEDLPKGPGAEMNDLAGKKPVNHPGVYRHEASGKELIIMADPKLGSSAQDALVRQGFVWVAPPPTRQELTKMQDAQLKQDLADEKAGKVPAPYMVPGEQAQVFNGTVTDTEGQGDALKAAQVEAAVLRQKLAAYEMAETAKAEADAKAAESNEEGGQ